MSVLFGLVLFGLIFSSLRQKDMDFREGSLASQTIRANKTIENKAETEEKRKLAESAIAPSYNYDEHITTEQLDKLTRLFDYVTKAKEEVDKAAMASANGKNKKAAPTLGDYVANLKGQFEKVDELDMPYFTSIPDSVLSKMFELSTSNLSNVKSQLNKVIADTMENHIHEDTLADYREKAKDSIDKSSLTDQENSLANSLIRLTLVPNEFMDEKKTEELKKTARQGVNPVMIYHGEVVVREGVQIDARAMNKLELLGMTNKDTSVFPYVALVLMIVLQLISLVWIVRDSDTQAKRFRVFHSYVFLMILSVLLMKGLSLFQTEANPFIPLLFPVALVPMILNMFVSRRASILAALFQVAFSLFVYYDLAGTSNLLLILSVLIFSGMMATLLSSQKLGRQRSKGILWLFIFPTIFVCVLVIYQGMQLSDTTTLGAIICTMIGSLISFVLAIGLHPYIDLWLNDDSMIVLNELSNPTQPLLKRLLEEAPGTYHHSMMVASLSANAVAAIGGRSLVTRVACYYHDIGKIKYSNFFVENLPPDADNPHDFLLPEDSKEIIFSHVTEGVKILEENHMPKMVIDICQQHHGTTLMQFFYRSALERNPDLKEEDFRYPGPKPQTREAAVVNIADTCEAGVRAMKQPTKESITEFVSNTIERRIKDGQLDESGITLGELKIVRESLINGLCSTFHSRIEYPKFKDEIEGKSK
ncbi:HD family phosphohydrolase [Vagococcus zengguangii]|uniref:HD family phosphohydrolase n=1 Tax=Vagococcus zengguangii TaxID=2571750 RepID=UPI001109F8AB|nr:HDIG domain-containing metalloprotein [Vagococcus zengguangii]TLG81434.1 HDIG domain-containing protein [Vagococcus zengguangii]